MPWQLIAMFSMYATRVCCGYGWCACRAWSMTSDRSVSITACRSPHITHCGMLSSRGLLYALTGATSLASVVRYTVVRRSFIQRCRCWQRIKGHRPKPAIFGSVLGKKGETDCSTVYQSLLSEERSGLDARIGYRNYFNKWFLFSFNLVFKMMLWFILILGGLLHPIPLVK